MDGDLRPQAAAEEIARVTTRTARAGRWVGWMWLTIAVTVMLFYLGTGSGSAVLADLAGPLPVLVGGAMLIASTRRHVIRACPASIEGRVAIAMSGA